MTEAERLREQAEHCLRLVRGSTDKTIIERLTELAAEYLERAHALKERRTGLRGRARCRGISRCSSKSRCDPRAMTRRN